MKISGAVLHEMGESAHFAESQPLKIETLDLYPPGDG